MTCKCKCIEFTQCCFFFLNNKYHILPFHRYFYIERGQNMCGLAACASYPLVWNIQPRPNRKGKIIESPAWHDLVFFFFVCVCQSEITQLFCVKKKKIIISPIVRFIWHLLHKWFHLNASSFYQSFWLFHIFMHWSRFWHLIWIIKKKPE